MNERPTFSPFWHRVRTLKPRLRPHVQINRQRYRGRVWHVVQDPASNQFYRLNPIAYEFVGLLDGKRDIEEAWKTALGKFGDSAPTQNEVIQLLSQLYSSNLLSGDVPPETEQLLRRGRERVKKKVQQQAIGIMYFKMRLFNPDRIISAVEPVLRPVLNRWGFLAWCVLLIAAVSQLLPRWEQLVDGFSTFTTTLMTNPAGPAIIAVVYILLKAFHELGHGVLCKRFGGQVPEFGAMLLVLFPSPYVDASAAWGFENKWHRVAVGAGGMLFELFVASIAAFVFVAAPEGSLTGYIAFNVLLTASVSTILFNANPLMRFDGYYILADLLETPNLAQRSNNMLKHLIQKYIYRLERPSAQLPSTQRSEQGILVTYGVLALAYRIFLFITITLFVMGQLFAIGLLLAIWTAAAWFIIPIGTFIHWLASNPSLSEQRARTVALSVLMIGAVVVALGVIPFPDHRRGSGVIEAVNRSGVFAGVDGFVVEAHARPGEFVEAGAPLLTMESRELVEQERQVRAMLDEVYAEERRARAEGRPAVAQIALSRADVLGENLRELQRRQGELVVRAPHAGVVVGNDPARLVGAYVRRGSDVCEVADPRTIRVAATLGQGDGVWLFDEETSPRKIGLRTRSAVERVVEGTNLRQPPAGRQELAHAAMGFSGGGQIEQDPTDRTGRVARRPVFTVYIDPVIADGGDGRAIGLPGERVRVRFTLPDRPLMSQWLDRLQKVMQGRVNV